MTARSAEGRAANWTTASRSPRRGSTTLWIGVAGSDQGQQDARDEFATLMADPGRALARKQRARRELSRWSRVDLPGDRRLADAVDWGKQNLADLTLTAENVQVRWTNQGKQFPAPSGNTVPSMTWFGAGYPDYPWLFATDGEYTSFAGVALGQFETVKDHLRALRDVSENLNPDTGVVVHEVVPDGSVWFGKDTPPHRGRPARDEVRLQHGRDGQVPEHGRARVAVDRRRRVHARHVRLLAGEPALRRRAA